MSVTRATAFAPASVANVAVGFDILGFSNDLFGDTAIVERTKEPTVLFDSITGLVTELPLDPKKNTAGLGLLALIEEKKLKHGFKVSIKKGIPLGSGMGGSAASAVAAIFAASELLETRLTESELLHYSLIGESVASGSYHADNIAPSLLGGLVLSRSSGAHAETQRLPIPKGLSCALLHQNVKVETKTARGILKPDVSLSLFITQSYRLASFTKSLFESDLELMGKVLQDDVIEPQRTHLIPGFQNIKAAALSAGAIGCTIAGAGPSVFAFARTKPEADTIASAMAKAAPLTNTSWSFELNSNGARVIA